ncbi:flagellar filament capping protein FliD [Candidatus Uabimicrobium amorphum]|uniref:Flagellar hook-associated protein 2 n=1 Tax=Uabimicrobium amorphum TaxID=2596890 RepID=A0A5S9INW3_UABAM|nr:flagellar filament capping protein FliD [Candidatus Uabimicrobium amorphum]BBM84977.1 flagellar hook-associated protein 2 [Candidatus Uabimicrobium amorphum]
MAEGTLSLNVGLATGIDFGSLVGQLISVERRPLGILQQRKNGFQAQKAAYDQLQTKMNDLKSAAQKIDGQNDDLSAASSKEELLTFKAKSDSDFIKASVKEGAKPATHNVKVNQLAQGTRLAHLGVDDKEAAISASDANLVINIGSSEETLEIKGGETTLEGLAAQINDLDASISASIVNDGSASNGFRLVISSGSTGVENAVSINDAETTLAGFATSDFEEVQQAKDAQITIDGIDISRGTNSVSDAIDGVTLELNDISEEEAIITVSRDNDAFKNKVSDFVSKINDVLSFVNANSGSSDNKASGVLAGDRVLISAQSRIRNLLTEAQGGVSLSEIGLTTGEDGLISFDSAKFLEAVDENPTLVRGVFAGGESEQGVSGRLVSIVKEFVDPTGFIATRQDGLQSSADSLQDQIDVAEKRLVKREDTLRKQFVNLEQVVSNLQSNQNFLLQQIGAV